mgnify:CR=1 FL=1
MKKRIISLILVLALCLSLLPMAAGAADGEPADEVLAQPADGAPADDAPQQPTDALRDTGSTGEGTHADHYYCGGATCAHNDPRLENAQPIATAGELLAAAAGSYYLTADTFLPSTWTPANGTVLCLNGKVLALRNAVGAVIHVAQNSTFTLLDCGAGKITHRGSSSGHGMLVDGTFNMYGGSITDNYGDSSRNEYAGGMYVSGTGKFYMYGGSIKNNRFSASDPNAPHISGVLVANGGTIELSRDADISDNGIMDDIYLCNGVKIAIGAGGLTSDNRFYTRMQYSPPYGSGETVEITYPTDTDVSRYFKGGGGSYCFINERPSDHVVLVTALLNPNHVELTVSVTPETLTLAQGTSGRLTVSSSAHGDYRRGYQWYQNTRDSTWGGTAIGSETANVFTVDVPDTLTPGTYYYFCTVTMYNSKGGIVQQKDAKAVVIVKKTALTVTQKNWTYGDAEPPRPTVTGLPEGVTLEQATVTYSVKDANNYSAAVPTERGYYTVKVEYTDADGLTYSGTCDFLIFSKTLKDSDLTLEYPRLTYNGTKQDIRHHLVVKLGDKTLTKDMDYAFVGEAVSVNANTVAANAYIDLIGNYSGRVHFNWYIDPLEVELALVNAENRKYGDGKGNVSLRVSNAIGQDTVNVTCDGGDVLTAGSDRTVTATALDNTNYKLPDDLAKRTFTYDVFRGDAPADPNPTLYVYNDAAQTYRFDFAQALPELADGLTFGSTIQYYTKTIYPEIDWFAGGAFDLDNTSGLLTITTERANRAADTTVCVYTIFVGSSNYETFEMTLTVKAKDKTVVTVPVTLEGWTCGQTPNTPNVEGLPAGAVPTFTYKDADGTVIADPTSETAAGDYTVTVRYETFDTIYTGTKGFTILPAPPQRQPMGITAPGRVPGGTIELRPKNAAPGQTVTILTTPDKGYELGGLTVRDIDGGKLDLTDEGGGEFTFVMPKSSVTVTGYFVREGEELFRDVPANAYYYDAVRWAKQNGITSGIGDGLFGSTLPCTRAQIVTFLWRAAGSPEPKSEANFADVPASAYYAKAVAWAVEEGITNGVGDNKFDPDAPCTRAQCVAFLYRAAGSPKVNDTADFEDVAENAYYAKAVAWAQKQDITDGVSQSRFAPEHDCTRAQIVAFLYRAFAE